MDIVLEACDTYVFDKFWASILPAQGGLVHNASVTLSSMREGVTLIPQQQWVWKPTTQYLSFPPTEYAWMSQVPRNNPLRQFVELFLIIWFFGVILYFVFATLSYIFIFDKTTFNHPKYLKNQIKLEIQQAQSSMPGMALMTAACTLAEVNGYAKFYDKFEDAPFAAYNYIQFPLFLLFTDFLIYWIHRGLHHPLVYKTLHKPHHKWIMPTPYASHAFHPVDGFAQSVPYHLFPFIFPLQKFAFIGLFGFINIWTIMIHDGEYIANSPIINGAACHTTHHLYFNFNFGQYTTLWDRLGGSYRKPNEELFKKETKMAAAEWHRQAKEMERIQKEVEGSVDDRQYGANEAKKVQ